MSLSVQDFKDFIIVPTLAYMEPEVTNSKPALQLLLGTAAKESEFYWLDQTIVGPGPAFGFYQMEENTYYTNWSWMAQNSRPLFEKGMNLAGGGLISGAARMRSNLLLATFLVRVHYFRVVEALPLTLAGQAAYWKKYYNTPAGSGTTAQYIQAYNKLVINIGGAF